MVYFTVFKTDIRIKCSLIAFNVFIVQNTAYKFLKKPNIIALNCNYDTYHGPSWPIKSYI